MEPRHAEVLVDPDDAAADVDARLAVRELEPLGKRPLHDVARHSLHLARRPDFGRGGGSARGPPSGHRWRLPNLGAAGCPFWRSMPSARGRGRGIGPAGDAELAEDGRDVVVDGPRREEEARRRSRGWAGRRATRRRTSSSRAVRPAGLARVAAAAPRGMDGAPSSRRRRAAIAAAGRAPRRSKVACASWTGVDVVGSSSARAASYGQSSAAQASAASRQRPSSWSRHGSAAAEVSVRDRRPAFACHQASSPMCQGWPWRPRGRTLQRPPQPALEVAGQPGRLGAGGAHRADALKRAGRRGDGEGLVERGPDVRIAATGPQPAEGEEGHHAADRRCACPASTDAGERSGLGPAAAVHQ